MSTVTARPDLIAEYAEHLRDLNRSAGTITHHQWLLRRLDAELPAGVAGATAFELRGFLRTGRSQNTRANYRATLSSFFTWACDPMEPRLDFNPMTRVPAASFHRGVPRPAETGDVDAVLKSAGGEYLVWFLLAAYGGLRCCEIAALERADITRQRIYVLHGKGDKERVVPCDDLVWREVEGLPGGPVARRKDGGRATGKTVTTRGARYLDRTGFGHITMHQFRHWYASQMYEQTGDILLVQQLLGHSNVATTQRYVQLGDGQRMRAVNSLPRLGRTAA